MKEISLPASTSLTLVTTVAGSRPGTDRVFFELHTPAQDVRIRFGDPQTLQACHRALEMLLADVQHLPEDAVTSRVITVHPSACKPRQLALF